MTDILFTHSYFLRFDPKEYRAMMPYPPLGTLIAANHVRRHGFSTAFHDVMFATSEAEIAEAIRSHQPRIVVIYDDQFNYLTKMCLSRMREAAFRMSGLAKRAGCTVIIFSSDATDHLEQYFDHDVDFVLCGEAEDTLVELASILLGRSASDMSSVDGLAYRFDGRICRTRNRQPYENLDLLPFPAWDLADLSLYRSHWQRHGYFSLNLVTTRGCPFHCNWCAKPIYGQVYHSRSPLNAVEEMEYLRSIANPDHLWFADDIFGLKRGWVEAFDEIVNREDARIAFKCLSRVDLLLEGKVLDHLKNAGCTTVWVGAESGSQKILDAMEKGTTVEQIHAASRSLHERGIRVGFFLQYGYPGETRDDIDRTLEMVRVCRPDEIGVSVSYPLPGTKFYERVKADIGSKSNWVDSQDLAMMYRGTFGPEFYRALHRVTHKKFRVWQGMDLAGKVMRSAAPLDRGTVVQLAKSAYHYLTLPAAEARMDELQTSDSAHVS